MSAQTVGHHPTRPCVHPTCRDVDGNPRLTQDVMCYPCRSRYRRELGWLIEDYVQLKSAMPSPARLAGVKIQATKEGYGHPAEWASYMCSEIAKALYDAEDNLRANQGDDPAAVVTTESRIINNAHGYLAHRFDQFCTFPDAHLHAEAIVSLHKQIRLSLGYTRLFTLLPMPCPECDVVSLTQQVGQVVCGNCGRTIREEDYGLLARIAAEWAMDSLINDYDAQHAEDEPA